MTVVLGQDLGAIALERFGDRIYKATLHIRRPGAYDINDPSSGSNATVDDHVCDAIAFGYKLRYVDGERIRKGDYSVVIIRTSVEGGAIPNPGDTIEIPPPGQTVARLGDIVLVEAITEAQITVQVRGAGE